MGGRLNRAQCVAVLRIVQHQVSSAVAAREHLDGGSR